MHLISKSICNHIHIGSASVYKLLRGKLSLADLHGFFHTWQQRREGKMAEDYYLSKNTSAEKISCFRSQILPFLLSSPDFIESLVNRRQVSKMHPRRD